MTFSSFRSCLILVLALAAVLPSIAQDAANGRAVIEAMHQKYKKKWYKNLTFKQKTTFYKDGKTDREETWFEGMNMPLGLVIKFGDMGSGDGLVFKSDSQYVYRDNRLISQTKRIHDLLVLGFSVYFESPEVSIGKLAESGYDFDHFELDMKEGGGTEFAIGNPDQAQFWVDTKTLLFTKLRKKDKDGNVSEIRFNQYRKLKKGWIAPEVVFLRNGQITLTEAYSEITAPKKLPAGLFDGGDFAAKRW
ncbi:MAG: hypothetical protein H6562_01060 [Lewinellaceae bacterium]|nr:hypothetical protein [Lewinella sp.]MCB9277477.1 hypothetical protein [Lewinellaceae bacterium]